jgi:dipeptidyl aminopeptidase/acylaminoacyl peptidase
MKSLRAALLALAGLVLTALPAGAAPAITQVLRASYGLHNLTHLSLSPSGALLWQESYHAGDPTASPPLDAVYLKLPGAAPVRIGALTGSTQTEPSFSRDGRRMAFFSSSEKGPSEIEIADAAGRNIRTLATLPGEAQNLQWSPDGRSLAILYIAHPHRKAGATSAGARQIGVIGSVIDEQRLAVVNASTGTLHELTPADVYVYEYAWSPNSARLAFTYAHGSGDNNWWIARLGTIAASGGPVQLVYTPALQINDPQWSPDGTRIAFISGLMSDFGSVGGDVYLVPAGGGTARDVTPGMRLSAAALHWTGNARIFMLAHDRGTLNLFSLDTANGSIAPLTSGPYAIRSVDATPDGSRVAIVRTSFDDPPEIYAGAPHRLAEITHVNAGAQRFWGKTVSLHWTNEGFHVQGWLIYPLGYDSHKRYPMVTIVHGGPSAESLPGFGSTFISALTSRGYFIFEPNPRGSFGQGEAFTRANVKDFGYGDWRDDLKGIDTAIASAPIDPKKLGLFGWSYGGYMAMWAETQTRRFKAIVAGAGVVNWQSYYGQNDIDQWMIPFFGASVYDDPQVYAKSSPITFIKHSRTPVLVLQGEYDEEVPAPQAFEFYHAMTALHVPARLVVYAGEGHAPRKIADQIDILSRMLGWFGRYL